MAEHFDYAGDILSDLVDENGSSSYWSDQGSICLAESDLMQELINPQTFQLRLQTCHNTFATASKRNTSILAFTEIKGDGLQMQRRQWSIPIRAQRAVHRMANNFFQLDDHGYEWANSAARKLFWKGPSKGVSIVLPCPMRLT